MGVKDDIIGTAPVKKLIAHIIVGFILVVMADIRILSMHGIFGVNKPLDLWQSYLLSIFVYTVIINAINLIDGLDGLAGLISFLASFCFGVLFYFSGNIPLSLLSMVLCGTMLGFIIFNFSPARVFMGDAGSQSLGATLAVTSILLKQEFVLAVAGGLFVIEAISVMIQVFYFKTTKGKRFFLMAPLHHHFEKAGLSEQKVVIRFWIVSFLFCLLALSLLKIR